MPIVNGKVITPDEAFQQRKCPECGIDLNQVNVVGHINEHWPRGFDPLDRAQDEGRRRMDMLKYVAGQQHVA